jgi:1-acyl-sn-glycerol-3-phosphate acyltransferase
MPSGPVIFCSTHHGWFDGYVIYHVVTKLGVQTLDWIQEFEAFPLFAKVGGMPFPADDPAKRAATIRKTIRLMNEEQRSLMLFESGILHPPPEVWPPGKALELVVRKTNATVLPTAIHYEFSMHERPEAFIAFGEPLSGPEEICERAHASLVELLAATREEARGPEPRFELLAAGTKDVNERWSLAERRKQR